MLSRVAKASAEAGAESKACEIVGCADAIIALVKQDDLAREFGVNIDKDDKVAVATRKEQEGTKAALITALAAKAGALLTIVSATELEDEKVALRLR